MDNQSFCQLQLLLQDQELAKNLVEEYSLLEDELFGDIYPTKYYVKNNVRVKFCLRLVIAFSYRYTIIR